MKPKKFSSLATHGFTLAELAIVLLIVGLLLAGVLTPLATQIEVKRIGDAQKSLEDIKEALIGYAISQSPPHLPCPDKTTGAASGPDNTPNDGREDFVAGACVVQEGNLPWTTLGIAPIDPWGNRFHYRVTAAFSNRLAPTMSLSSVGDILICPAKTGCSASTAIAVNVPAVILSYGKNGYGAVNASGGTNPPVPAANNDETENTDQNTNFVSRPRTDQGATAGEFDDVVVWLSPNVLFSRLVSAWKLP